MAEEVIVVKPAPPVCPDCGSIEIEYERDGTKVCLDCGWKPEKDVEPKGNEDE